MPVALRRTKIVCTIGPASRSRKMLEQLMRAGMDVARLNFSHGTHQEHAEVIAHLRSLARDMKKPLAILQDLSGPKMRLGDLHPPEIMLRKNQTVGFTSQEIPEQKENCCLLPLPLPELMAALTPGRTLLLDDGKITMRVLGSEGQPHTPGHIVWAKCLTEGGIRSRKGICAPGTSIAIPAVTEKDLVDLEFGLQQGVDWVAASFVRSADDLQPIYHLMRDMHVRRPVLAKIEKMEAVQNFASILKAVDGIMVARGDLGVEMDYDEVPIVQKRLIRACNRAARPVITATQMLESMLSCPRPTRAEAADVANAILDGTDAVMLSGETASGQYPLEAVRTMARIALRTDTAFAQHQGYAQRLEEPNDITAAVSRASADIAREVRARAILCATTSGSTARQVASHRPPVPILGVTNQEDTYHALSLTWGVTPCLVETVEDTDSMMSATLQFALQSKHIQAGDCVVLTAGVPVNHPGTTNLIRVHEAGAPL